MRFAGSFAAQLEPLRNTEAVLLVDDQQSETRQQNFVLEQCVGADGEHRIAAGHRGERRLALLRRQSPR